MKLRADVNWNHRPGEPGYLLDSRTGGIHALNPTAALIIEGLQAGEQAAGLEQSLCDHQAADELTARADVAAFLRLLLENDLVEH